MTMICGRAVGHLLDLLEDCSNGADVAGLNATAATLCQLVPVAESDRMRAFKLLLQLLISDVASVSRLTHCT